MTKKEYAMFVGITTAACTTAGALINRKNPAIGGMLGAAAGFIAGTLTAEIYRRSVECENVFYYSRLSPLYQNEDDYGLVR